MVNVSFSVMHEAQVYSSQTVFGISKWMDAEVIHQHYSIQGEISEFSEQATHHKCKKKKRPPHREQPAAHLLHIRLPCQFGVAGEVS